jgi:hypothetical protein
MGAGTASEAALALKSAKPVVLVNADVKTQAFFKGLSSHIFAVTNSIEAVSLAKGMLQI